MKILFARHTIKVCFAAFIFSNIIDNASAQNRGLLQPQEKNTLPVSLAPFSVAVKKNKQALKPVLALQQNEEYALEGGWEMQAANDIKENGAIVSQQKYQSKTWFNATVPGTVLTTLVNNGIYPDPAFGLNNLAIPDTLCRQQWWYRTNFIIEKNKLNKSAILTFNGINYIADVWVNGNNVGTIKGAFRRGIFDVTKFLHEGTNSLAVLITPPPHPGIPHEESPSAGRGPNGGALCADGPTFISSEGWDWVPGIRDRNIGIWQNVTLKFVDAILIEDPQVITQLSLPDTSSAELTVKVHVKNISSQLQKIKVNATIESVKISTKILLQAGESRELVLSPKDFAALHFSHPRLWWPNGYGNPELYQLKLTASVNNKTACKKSLRFGIRELSYELSVDAPQQPALRIDYKPTVVLPLIKQAPFNNSKRRHIEGETVIPSVASNVDANIFTAIKDLSAAPYLVIKVNGKRIFCKGGNWGMDDYMKRTSRSFLEPYFRLHRDAHFNMVRNWTGESTEEIFYQLCDEYGLLVWNDFWISTEHYNIEPTDNTLFLDNVKDVVHRFRNHPSIAIWCARNEGYAPPALEDSLANIIVLEDGTRYYQSNSRYLNLRTSGPWHYQQQPSKYFTSIAEGFSTELGTPAVPTAASMRKMMSEKDVWPVKDVWYYHDLHFGQIEYRRAIDSLYGNAKNLEDFCAKAQLVNYDSHRAMFESWNSKLFNKASGLLLWMTHPAWPSTVWQVYSWDYETFGAYFGALKACEPVHVQMNLHDNKVIAVNTSLNDYRNCKASINVYDLKGKKIFSQSLQKNISSNTLTEFFTLQLPTELPEVYLVRVELQNEKGVVLSINDYWKTNEQAKNFTALQQTGKTKLMAKKIDASNGKYTLSVENVSSQVAIAVKLNLIETNTKQIILPAYFTDGYFNLLPGEKRTISVEYNNKSNEKKQVMLTAFNADEIVFDL
jgi:hypothetical protein